MFSYLLNTLTRFKTVNVIFTAFLFLLGVQGFLNLKRESYPPVDFAKATVVTIYPGSSPEEVEETITRKIEDELKGVNGLKDVKSVSQAGRSEISIRIDIDNEDTDEVMDDIQRAIQRVTSLPEGVRDQPSFRRLKSGEIPVTELGVYGDIDSRTRDSLARDLEDLLEQVPGVSDVRLAGYRASEIQILIDPIKLSRFQIGINEVTGAVRRQTQEIPAGFIKSDSQEILVRVREKETTAQGLEKLVLRSNFEGNSILLRDVATITNAQDDPLVLARLNGEPATLLTIAKKENADTLQIVKEVNERLERFRKSLPGNAKIAIYNDEGERVANKLQIVTTNAIGGLVLVLIVLLVFLPGILGLVTAVSLPIAIMGTVAVMAAFDITFNTITMLGIIIALGMLVDNAIVISEIYAQNRERGVHPIDGALSAVQKFWAPITATALTTIAAFLPMLVTLGVMGQFIRFIPIVVTIALVISLLEGFILLPGRLTITVQEVKTIPGKEKGWFTPIYRTFERFILMALRRRYLGISAIFGLLIASIVLMAVGDRFVLFPKEGVEFYVARFELPLNTPVEVTHNVSLKVDRAIRDVLPPEDILYTIDRAGIIQTRPGDPNSKTAPHVGMIVIAVPRDRAAEQDAYEVQEKLRQINIPEIPTLMFESLAGGPPVGEALNITFRSRFESKLREFVDRFKAELMRIPGVRDVQDDEITGSQEYSISLNQNLIRQIQLTTEDVGSTLRTALQGSLISTVVVQGDEVDVRLRLPTVFRQDLEALKQVPISDQRGNLIPLGRLAQFEEKTGPSLRKRFDFQRSITITADVNPQDLTAIALNRQAEKIFQNLLKEYDGISVVVGGEAESTNESIQSLMRAMGIAFLGILLILVFLYRSFLRPLLILGSIPLGIIGVSVAFYLHQKPIGFFALIGVVALAGVVVNSAIVLVSYVDDLRESNPQENLDVLLARASADRLRPIIATGLTTIAGLMPTAYGIGGHEPVLVPMTLALSWGLMVGTLFTLIWIPLGYRCMDDFLRFLDHAVSFLTRFVRR